jgi:hypothetical protein
MRTLAYEPQRFEESFAYHKPYAIASSLTAVATIDLQGILRFNLASPSPDLRAQPADAKLDVDRPVGLCVSADGGRVWVASTNREIVAFERDAASGLYREIARHVPEGSEGFLFKIACDDSGRFAVITASLTNFAFVMDVSEGAIRVRQRLEIEGSSRLVARPSLSADALVLAIGGTLLARASPTGPFKQVLHWPDTERIVFNTTADRLVALGRNAFARRLDHDNGQLRVGQEVQQLGSARDRGFLNDDFVFLARDQGDLEVVRIAEAALVGRLVFRGEDGWLLADPAGRFDTSDVENERMAHWVAPDDPLTPLAPELFMRDYFEPRLLPRLLRCLAPEAAQSCKEMFPDVRPLGDLNRAQPSVRIVAVSPEPSTADEVAVTLEVAGVERRFGNKTWRSGAYDLRLFRDGQLVAQFPAEALHRQDGSRGMQLGSNLQRWRDANVIVDSFGKMEVVFHHIRIPTLAPKEPVVFTAYAFNEDRVKSATARSAYEIPAGTVARKPKAYVVTIGVNGYETQSLNLRFAANDARAMRHALAQWKDYDVVSVSLVSEIEPQSWQATTDNIQEILARLAGKSGSPDTLRGVEGANNLARATPDDLVIVTFAGHGHTEADGTFYLIPSDSGSGTTPDRSRFISSEELGNWLRPVDAGRMAMIIDACHAAASVEQLGFKPGPMGDRGLGQLDYDKAMIVLAASQADDIALESERLEQGLLTFALVRDGLARGAHGRWASDTDNNGALTLLEWLRYGALRTPTLYEDIRTLRRSATYVGNNRALSGRNSLIDPAFRESMVRTAQTPALFDFQRQKTSPILLPDKLKQ